MSDINLGMIIANFGTMITVLVIAFKISMEFGKMKNQIENNTAQIGKNDNRIIDLTKKVGV